MNDEKLIWEAYTKTSLPTVEEVLDAAETQRGIPESQMLRCQRIIPSVFMCHLIEHIGDLSHRAQRQNQLMNVDEKLRIIENCGKGHRLTLEQELWDNYVGDAESYVIENNPELKQLWDIMDNLPAGNQRSEAIEKRIELLNTKYKPQVEEIIKHLKEITRIELDKYTKAHEEHNKPITTLGHLGKDAAIALGNQNFDLLRSIVKQMRQWLNEYYNLKTEKQRLKKFLS
jgi:DNA repair ATPase RecN